MIPNILQKSYDFVRGFNYQPSYGSHEVEIWKKFDPQVVELELRRGKWYFPKMNCIRIWMSWNAFMHGPDHFGYAFDKIIDICGQLDLSVQPCLFNRWHDPVLDWGGIYTDHFVPRVSWISREWEWWKGKRNDKMFDAYIERIVGPHAKDERIFSWDMACEPFSYYEHGLEEHPHIRDAEFNWLKGIREHILSLGAVAPITVGMHNAYGIKGYEFVETLCDIICFHSYWIPGTQEKKDFEKELDDTVAFAEKVGKPIINNETCWGKHDHQEHVEVIKYTLGELVKRKIGFLPHALHWSGVADLHYPEDGPTAGPENLAFIDKDGSLRPGHEVYNDFC